MFTILEVCTYIYVYSWLYNCLVHQPRRKNITSVYMLLATQNELFVLTIHMYRVYMVQLYHSNTSSYVVSPHTLECLWAVYCTYIDTFTCTWTLHDFSCTWTWILCLLLASVITWNTAILISVACMYYISDISTRGTIVQCFIKWVYHNMTYCWNRLKMCMGILFPRPLVREVLQVLPFMG